MKCSGAANDFCPCLPPPPWDDADCTTEHCSGPSPELPPPSPPAFPPTSSPPAPSSLTLALSGRWELVTLTKVRADATNQSAHWPIPCARTYEGNPWELVMPRAAGSALVEVTSCSSVACELLISHDPEHTYSVHSTNLTRRFGSLSSSGWYDRVASRLLTQATFGPTRSSIANLSLQFQSQDEGDEKRGDGAALRFVLDQMALAPTLHRAYLRQRASPRLEHVTEVRVAISDNQ